MVKSGFEVTPTVSLDTYGQVSLPCSARLVYLVRPDYRIRFTEVSDYRESGRRRFLQTLACLCWISNEVQSEKNECCPTRNKRGTVRYMSLSVGEEFHARDFPWILIHEIRTFLKVSESNMPLFVCIAGNRSRQSVWLPEEFRYFSGESLKSSSSLKLLPGQPGDPKPSSTPACTIPREISMAPQRKLWWSKMTNSMHVHKRLLRTCKRKTFFDYCGNSWWAYIWMLAGKQWRVGYRWHTAEISLQTMSLKIKHELSRSKCSIRLFNPFPNFYVKTKKFPPHADYENELRNIYLAVCCTHMSKPYLT